MIYFLNWVKRHSQAVFLTVIGFSLFIVFESFQQLFYANNFNNGNPSSVGFWEVFKEGIYRWLIWLAVVIPLVLAILKLPARGLSKKSLTRLLGFIVIALVVNLAIISIIHPVVRNGSWANFPEIFEFYFFHKAPIMLVSFVFLIVLVYYFRSQNVLDVTIKEVGELQKTNEELFDRVSNGELNAESLVFEVKTGNRVKLLSEASILWIGAEDYCVRMHTLDGASYVVRTSLKALEAKLPAHRFLRVHRKAIVSLARIKAYHQGTNPRVVLSDDTELPIAQSRLKAFRDQLQPI